VSLSDILAQPWVPGETRGPWWPVRMSPCGEDELEGEGERVVVAGAATWSGSGAVVGWGSGFEGVVYGALIPIVGRVWVGRLSVVCLVGGQGKWWLVSV